MRASCSKIPNGVLSAANCSCVSLYLFMISINIILLYTLNLSNTSLASGFNISGATDYLHTRTQTFPSNTETYHFQVRYKEYCFSHSRLGGTNFFFSGLRFPDCGSIPLSPGPRAQQLYILCSRHAKDTIAVTRQSLRQELRYSSIAQMGPRETVVLEVGYILQDLKMNVPVDGLQFQDQSCNPRLVQTRGPESRVLALLQWRQFQTAIRLPEVDTSIRTFQATSVWTQTTGTWPSVSAMYF
jgi:hypothetical protein